MRISIKARLWLASILMIGLIAACTIAGYSLTGVAAEQAKRTVSVNAAERLAANHASAELQQLRRLEVVYMAKPDEKVAAELSTTVQNLQLRVGEILKLTPSDTRRATAQELDERIMRYQSAFGQLHGLAARVGLTPETGLYGQLRTAVHDIEASIAALGRPELTVHLLMCRRHEKDYMLRRDDKYLAETQSEIEKFNASIKDVELDEAVKADVKRKWDIYWKALNDWVSGTKELANGGADLQRVSASLEATLTSIGNDAGKDVEQGQAATLSTLTSTRDTLLWILVFGTLAGSVTGFLLVRSILRPITVLGEHVARVGTGDLQSRCSYEEANELGDLARQMNAMTAEMHGARERERGQAEKDAREKRELQEKVDSILTVVRAAGDGDLTQRVSVSGNDAVGQLGAGVQRLIVDLNDSIRSISHSATALASSSEEMSATAQQMASNSEETSTQANTVSSASEQVSQNLQTVATSTEEMTASIREISQNANSSAKVATHLVHKAEETNQTVAKLSVSSAEIGVVIKTINAIAQQTNLLALNATIEAARAGEAGKGFAVVANEVKELARETAKATGEISRKIEAIQGDASQAVRAIQEMGGIINEINGISNSIASAVEEQTATTNEIGRNVAEAARGATEISQNIVHVAKAASDTSSGASNAMSASSSLAELAADLQRLVQRFKLADTRSAKSAATLPAVNGNGHAHKSGLMHGVNRISKLAKK